MKIASPFKLFVTAILLINSSIIFSQKNIKEIIKKFPNSFYDGYIITKNNDSIPLFMNSFTSVSIKNISKIRLYNKSTFDRVKFKTKDVKSYYYKDEKFVKKKLARHGKQAYLQVLEEGTINLYEFSRLITKTKPNGESFNELYYKIEYYVEKDNNLSLLKKNNFKKVVEEYTSTSNFTKIRKEFGDKFSIKDLVKIIQFNNNL